MRSCPGSFRLTFLLPPGSRADSGIHQPSSDGCVLTVTFPLAEILGPSRQATFEHAARLLRVACRRMRCAIAATLETAGRPAARDSWSIIVGADVAFSPTSLGPYFPGVADAPPPSLALVSSQ